MTVGKHTRYTFLGFLITLVAFLVTPAELDAQELFFEQPRLLQDERARFPFVTSIDDTIVAIFQERTEATGEAILLKILTSEDGREWEEQNRIADPISFSGTEPNVFSATSTPDGNIYVAVGESDTRTAVYRVSSGGESVTRLGLVDTEVTSVAPVISSRDDGGLVLAINRDDEAEQRIYVAASDNGRNWSEFERIEAQDRLALSFAPEHESAEDREILVFQGIEAGSGMGYQLYISESRDGGQSWTEARRLTDFSNPGGTEDPDSYDNQRPHLSRSSDAVHLTWERSFGRQSTRVFTARIDDQNTARSIIQVSQGLRSAGAPKRFEFEQQEYYIWFEERSGRQTVVLAEPRRLEFDYRIVSDIPGDSTIPHVVVHNDRLHIFWQNARNGIRGLAYLEPDQRAAPPILSGSNFTPGARAPRETAEVRLQPPPDPSGIRGYSYVWSRDPDMDVPRELNVENERGTVRLDTDEDGEWFLRARAQDRAGNWSEPETITFLRDLSPPDPVIIEEPAVDDDGFLVSNTFEIAWEPSVAEYLAGYTYTFTRIGPATLASVSEDRLPDPPDRVITTNTSIARNNIDNGTWVFRVAAIDDIGNVGEPETIVLRLNKYVPVTYVTRVTSSVDLLGRTTIEITGRGFAEGGDVTEVILDRDGEEPYDYVFTARENDYVVVDDRNISGPVIETIDDGEYQLGLVHPDRGLYFANRTLALEATGTVKFGDYSTPYVPRYTADTTGYSLPMPTLLLWLTSTLLVMLIVFSITRMAAIVREVKTLQADVLALVGGTPLPEAEREGRIKKMKQKGVGLRVKFTAFFVTLVIAVVLLVALPLGNFIIGTQQETLTNGLRERTNILLDSIVAGSVQFLPEAQENLFELNSLTFQTDPIPETLHATITEYRPGEEIHEVVWASNDPRVTSPENYPEDEQVTDTDRLLRGQTRYEDSISEDIPELAESIEQQAEEALGDIPDRIDRLNEERITIAVEGGPNAEQEVGEIDDTISELETQQREILNEIGNVVVSVPELSSDTVLTADTTRYIFYKPIVYREIGEDIFFHGIVRVGVSSERIIGEINEAQQNLITTTAIITVVAVLGGIVGALILASIIVIPISKLVRGVEVIRDTEDKARLSDHQIALRSHDELRMLAESINDMTQGLVRAAVANKDLTVGKEVQKMFIPLRTDEQGNKLTTARDENDHIEFFGYYEGAKGVSGDYFNYRQIDSEHYAIIKCDVAGKGVPAALIMVEVATLYLSYFRSWNKSKVDEMPEIVETINDLLEERGFKGRFAAFTLAILNIRTGLLRICNAGDTLLYTYRAAPRQLEQTTLPSMPAAGVFPSDLMPNGFPQVTHQLEVGDILVLFTDGLEEAQRHLRDSDFNVMWEKDADGNDVDNEEFGIPRINEIVRAVEGRGVYRLERKLNPVTEDLVFDFSELEPTGENAVLALIAIEKMFRLVPDPSATGEDRVYVDVVLDEFLSRTFNGYQEYFRYHDESRSNENYRVYSHLMEEEQYDDLTILSVRKK